MRLIARCEPRQPKAPRRSRLRNFHWNLSAIFMENDSLDLKYAAALLSKIAGVRWVSP